MSRAVVSTHVRNLYSDSLGMLLLTQMIFESSKEASELVLHSKFSLGFITMILESSFSSFNQSNQLQQCRAMHDVGHAIQIMQCQFHLPKDEGNLYVQYPRNIAPVALRRSARGQPPHGSQPCLSSIRWHRGGLQGGLPVGHWRLATSEPTLLSSGPPLYLLIFHFTGFGLQLLT